MNEFRHEFRDEVMRDPETGEEWECNVLFSEVQVGDQIHGISTATTRSIPTSMTPEEWQAHRCRLNELALKGKLGLP